MPAYQYVCPKCGDDREIFKPMSDSSREEICGSNFLAGDVCDAVLVRDFNGQASTFRLKGNGWTGNNLMKKGK